MSSDAELIAKAIEALQPKPDYLKDYVFPALMMFSSALLGGVVALKINKAQELQRITRDNFSTSLQTFILAHECLNNLVAIKANYVDKIIWDEPLYRALAFPTMLAKLDEVKFSSTGFYFIRGMPTANKGLLEFVVWWIKHRLLRMEVKRPPTEEIAHTWRNTVRISCMFENYNQIMMFLRFRNEISEQIKEPLSRVDTSSMQSLAEFPDIAESNIELSRIRDWGKLPRYENEKEVFKKCLTPIVKPDFQRVAAYTGGTVDEVRKQCTFKDWGDA